MSNKNTYEQGWCDGRSDLTESIFSVIAGIIVCIVFIYFLALLCSGSCFDNCSAKEKPILYQSTVVVTDGFYQGGVFSVIREENTTYIVTDRFGKEFVFQKNQVKLQ